MKKNLPYKLLYYISIEFLNSIFIIFLVFLSLSLLVNFVEEITFFKDKNLENFIISVFYLAISKTPNTIIELSIFIFLFSGILFFVKMQKNSEINTMLLSGISKFIPICSCFYFFHFWYFDYYFTQPNFIIVFTVLRRNKTTAFIEW